MRRLIFVTAILTVLSGCTSRVENQSSDIKNVVLKCKQNVELMQKLNVKKYNVYNMAFNSWVKRERDENMLRSHIPPEALKIMEPMHTGEIRRLCFTLNADVIALLIRK